MAESFDWANFVNAATAPDGIEIPEPHKTTLARISADISSLPNWIYFGLHATYAYAMAQVCIEQNRPDLAAYIMAAAQIYSQIAAAQYLER